MRAGAVDSRSISVQQRQVTGLDEVRERQRESGLQTDQSRRRVLELLVLLLQRVRRVVGGDRIDRAVGQALDHRDPIGFGAQRRIDLGVGVVVLERVVGQREVMRGRLGRDPEASTLASRTSSTVPAVEM